ncbi:hypothetical protein [Pseudonocardia aurantiaca]|uniref:ABC transmembrane type-1 domain-containing protein n=1 Tax=Pseudonocardia aurantiaca TaxID=75290 RepID=A0ABW4FCG1_9PSEU
MPVVTLVPAVPRMLASVRTARVVASRAVLGPLVVAHAVTGIMTRAAAVAPVVVVLLLVSGVAGCTIGGFRTAACMRTLVMAISQLRGRLVQLSVHIGGLGDSDTGPRRGHVLPNALDDRCELGTWRAGDDDDVRVGRAARRRPTAPGDRGFDRRSCCGTPGGGYDEYVRTPSRRAEQHRGQVHRSAPSRQA